MARRRSGKKIDFVHWTSFSAGISALTAGTSGVNVLPAQHEPETLLRMRGEWRAGVDGTSAPPTLALIAVGIILVPEGTGTTVLWSPTTDGDAPWIWYDVLHIGYEELVTDVIGSPSLSFARRVIDNKAMRIVRNQEIQLVIENSTLDGAAQVNVNVAGRILSGK